MPQGSGLLLGQDHGPGSWLGWEGDETLGLQHAGPPEECLVVVPPWLVADGPAIRFSEFQVVINAFQLGVQMVTHMFQRPLISDS